MRCFNGRMFPESVPESFQNYRPNVIRIGARTSPEYSTCGQTREEVLSNLKEALASYVTTSIENNMEIPEPLRIDDFKGSITYRTSKERHYKLAKQAKLYGKSINAFIDEAIGEKLKEAAL